MSLKLEDIKKMLDTLGHLEKKGKKKVSDIGVLGTWSSGDALLKGVL